METDHLWESISPLPRPAPCAAAPESLGAAAADHFVGDDEDRRRRLAHRALLPRYGRDRHVQRGRTGQAADVDLRKLADVLVGHVQQLVHPGGRRTAHRLRRPPSGNGAPGGDVFSPRRWPRQRASRESPGSPRRSIDSLSASRLPCLVGPPLRRRTPPHGDGRRRTALAPFLGDRHKNLSSRRRRRGLPRREQRPHSVSVSYSRCSRPLGITSE